MFHISIQITDISAGHQNSNTFCIVCYDHCCNKLDIIDSGRTMTFHFRGQKRYARVLDEMTHQGCAVPQILSSYFNISNFRQVINDIGQMRLVQCRRNRRRVEISNKKTHE